jgi:tryptophan synthase alpha chain
LSDLLASRWATLRKARRPALIPYLTAGYPDRSRSIEALRVLQDAGADILEVGMPFSDPLADGPVIQASTAAALRQGMNVAGMLDLLGEAALETPVVAFGYVNPILQYGVANFLRDARAVGVAGLLVTDVPVGEDVAFDAEVRASGMPLIPLVAPTTSDRRLERMMAEARGFVYLIARLGVTGAPTTVGGGVAHDVARVRRHTDLPVVVGFGIAEPREAAAVARLADGVVVGSAMVRQLDAGVAAMRTFATELRHALDAAVDPL